MSKVFSICTNLTNGAGLQRDYQLLRRMLEARGHTVHGVQFNDYYQALPQADVMISLEVMEPKFFASAKEHWFVPNSEWFMPWFKQFIPRVFSRVLCKTPNALRIWSKLCKVAEPFGWESLDMYDPAVVREPKFLHLAGKSQTKNTEAVIEAWKTIPHTLTFVASREEVIALAKNAPNVHHIGRVADDEISDLLNSHLFHIMPSQQEGFGMALHESISCGAVVLTTDAPSMNEIPGVDSEMLIPVARKVALREDIANYVTPDSIRATVERALSLSSARTTQISESARQGYLDDRTRFRQRFEALIASI